MTLTRGQNWQIVQDAALPAVGTSARTSNENILSKVNLHLDRPLRLFAALTPDSKLYVTASSVESGDGTLKSLAPFSGTLVHSPAGSIDFQNISTPAAGITLTRDGGVYAHPLASATGKYIVLALVRTASGSFDAHYSAEQNTFAAAAALDVGSLFAPLSGIEVGYVYLESTDTLGRWKTAGSTLSVIENKNSIHGTSIRRINLSPATLLKKQIDAASSASTSYVDGIAATLQANIDTIEDDLAVETERNDDQDALITSVTASLTQLINDVAADSDAKDDLQDAALAALDTELSGLISAETSARQTAITNLETSLLAVIDAVELALTTEVEAIKNGVYIKEETIEVVTGSVRTYAVTGFTFSSNNIIKDIQVFKNASFMRNPLDYTKTSTTQIQFTYDLQATDLITIVKR